MAKAQTHIIEDVKIKWTRLREEQRDYEYDPQGTYSVVVYDMPQAIIDKLKKLNVTLFESENGPELRIKRKHAFVSADGETKVIGPPQVLTADGVTPFDWSTGIGNGSVADVMFTVNEFTQGKKTKYTPKLVAVMITKLIPYVTEGGGFKAKGQTEVVTRANEDEDNGI